MASEPVSALVASVEATKSVPVHPARERLPNRRRKWGVREEVME